MTPDFDDIFPPGVAVTDEYLYRDNEVLVSLEAVDAVADVLEDATYAEEEEDVAQGLGVLHSHLVSVGVHGPGFAAVYPKFGGMSEACQIACRASAVAGGVYMLGEGVDTHEPLDGGEDEGESEQGDPHCAAA